MHSISEPRARTPDTRPVIRAKPGASTGARLRRAGEVALAAATFLGTPLAIWAAFGLGLADDTGPIYRILYFHVPVSWLAYLAFFVVCVASIVYLWRGDERWDWVARASAESGVVFTTLALFTGSMWGYRYWHKFWIWDPRLTTTLILWFIYVGYLLLRYYTGRAENGARIAAVVGILGFVAVPINYMSVTWWRAQHPDPYVVQRSATIPWQVNVALLICLLWFTALYGYLLVQGYRLERARTQVDRLRIRLELGEPVVAHATDGTDGRND